MKKREKSPVDWKVKAQEMWNSHPCGAIDRNETDLSYFLEVERHRYEDHAPWMKEALEFDRWAGKRVLELGYGQGTDLVQHAKGGAECFGVDITPRHYELANTNFDVRGLDAALLLEDAANLPFPDASFDRVYSVGVLHHTPDTEACVAEAHRVLRPGGEFVVGMYHKWSAFHVVAKLLFQGILKRDIWRLGYDGLMATVEVGADGARVKPLVKVYSRRQMRKILRKFSAVSLEVHHLESTHFGGFGRFLPDSLIDRLEPFVGWYVIGRAVR